MEPFNVNVNNLNSLEAVNATEECSVHSAHQLLFVVVSFYNVIYKTTLVMVYIITCYRKMLSSEKNNVIRVNIKLTYH